MINHSVQANHVNLLNNLRATFLPRLDTIRRRAQGASLKPQQSSRHVTQTETIHWIALVDTKDIYFRNGQERFAWATNLLNPKWVHAKLSSDAHIEPVVSFRGDASTVQTDLEELIKLKMSRAGIPTSKYRFAHFHYSPDPDRYVWGVTAIKCSPSREVI